MASSLERLLVKRGFPSGLVTNEANERINLTTSKKSVQMATHRPWIPLMGIDRAADANALRCIRVMLMLQQSRLK